MTGRKMGRQIQHSFAESLKKQRWKERQQDETGEDFAYVLSDRGLKDLPNKMTPQPEHERERGGGEGRERQKGETAHSESSEKKTEMAVENVKAKKELREKCNDNNEGD